MARPLGSNLSTGTRFDSSISVVDREGGRLDRAAARAFAAAISSLIIATLVVSQSADALDPEGTVAGNSFEAGTIALTDDDQGRSLLSLTDMAPDRPTERCINVVYEGTILPADISLAATTTGVLADFLAVDIEAGSGGGFETCDGFAPGETIYEGTVGDLAAAEPMLVAIARNVGDEISFRFRFVLLDDARAVGQSASLDFVWEAVPS